MDSSDDDDMLFSYNNKQKLTFSSKVDFTNLKGDDSDSDSESDDDDDDDVVVEDIKSPANNETDVVEVTTTPAVNPLLKQIAEYNNVAISPSSPTTTDTPSPPKKKRCTRRTTRKNKNSAPVDISLLKKRYDASDDDEGGVISDVVVTTPTPVESTSILLKIRVHGAIEKYEVKRFLPLAKLIADIAAKENVVASHISLGWGNTVLDPSKSAKILGLTIADILECYIHDSNTDKENEISVTVRSANNSSTFAVTSNECVERVLKEFVNKHHPDDEGCWGKTKFSFDGEAIKDVGSVTFASLDMMDGDIIDAVVT